MDDLHVLEAVARACNFPELLGTSGQGFVQETVELTERTPITCLGWF
jgi:hypothetical protein